MFRLRAVCSPSLDTIAAQELRALGRGRSGLEWTGEPRELYLAALRLRCAERLAVSLGSFRAESFAQLVGRARELPWERFLKPGRPVAFRVDCRKSKLYHERGIAERLAAAAAARLGTAPDLVKFDESAQGPLPQLFFVTLERDVCVIEADASGLPLHKRGYRLETAKAPLRETLAAAMVLASGWRPEAPLLDPFCGSGTIAIEAALLARNIAPGMSRRFAFMDWPDFDAGLWQELRAKAKGEEKSPKLAILASDRDEGAIRAARANAERAGVSDSLRLSCRALSAVEPPAGPGWVVTNPPYGLRIKGGKDLRDLYARLGTVLRERCSGWRAAVLCADPRLLRGAGLRLDEVRPMMNGGLPVSLVLGRAPKAY